jgi:pimeloyl-ACP methyl ester carboxylesterase
VFDRWADSFPNTDVFAVDLQADLDPAHASMADYAQNVVSAVQALPRPVSVCGWSMGGLVALQAAQEAQPHSVILLEASAPAEVQGFNPDIELEEGTFDPEVEYGQFPPGVRSRLESLLARSERTRGIAVPSLPCPSLVVYAADFPDERGTALVDLYGSTELAFPNLHHLDLVLDPQVRQGIAAYLRSFG